MAKQSASFALTFVALFALTFTFLAMVDALPEPLPQNPSEQTPARTSDVLTPEQPIRIVAKSIGMDNTVLNPTSTDVEVLDSALLNGTVRYPQSALLGVDGTVLIFGHSSYLPIVRNQNYKAFNGIQRLKVGATVSVYSGTAEYRYTVTSVRLANATEDVVELPSDGKYLTLVTCDSFGKKSARFVVTAEFAGAYAL
jgi:LPXTG-site transpeptidase (sortase) family protein